MTTSLTRGLGAAFAFAAIGGTASADLTAQDVWSDWKEYLSSAGYAVDGDERMAGDVLTIENLSVTMQAPDTDGTLSIDLDGLSFTETGDGSVSITMPARVPMTFRGEADSEGPVTGVLTYSQTGHALVASGDPENLLYSYTAETAALDLSSLDVDGKPVATEDAQMSFALTNIVSSTRMTLGSIRAYAQSMTADSLEYDFAFEDPESDDNGTFSGRLERIGFDGTGAIPRQMSPDDINQMLEDGFEVDGSFTYASGASRIEGVGEGQAFAFTSASQGGSVGVRMDADQIAYDLKQTDTALGFVGGELPFPIEMQAAQTGASIAIPVGTSEEPQDFALGVTLTDFVMSEALWSIFDPAAALPRDPATLALDLSGKARVLLDFLDPEVAERLDETGETPVELEQVTLNKLLVSLVGASLSGTGAFSFDNSDLTTFEGIPRPTGAIDLQLVGGNALLDNLLALGFIGEAEAMTARGMMAVLAQPGAAPDTMNSKIEITEQGHVLANGQRFR
ncbi:DUF2125 domain-containing protein [Sedimentitalea arenosa]|uniref:DUF2125 domain-containing protein n=1 Tax=Sedimentitalea arenosa TaxID=2798803 RepID=A0A8J7J8W5_9RHOB|nr:DUF2125 domain-containing protein [Arenibacterium arenosum]MBJ6372892.1 DUF2125 domain-containing protein [Arenibacterium arenosum]